MAARISLVLLILQLLAGFVSPVSAIETSQLAGEPSINISKKICAESSSLPVFVESQCVDSPESSFLITDPLGTNSVLVQSGETYSPIASSFSSLDLWLLEDQSPDASEQGTRVVSCLTSEPGSNWNSSVSTIVHPEALGTVLIDWVQKGQGGAGESYRPSLNCIWLELPNLEDMPSVLSLQVFESQTSYLNWAEVSGPTLPYEARGSSGDDFEADMAMTNIQTGEAYTFAADDYGQVIVPSGDYSLSENSNGITVYFSMNSGQTTLVEMGLADQSGNSPTTDPEVEILTFSAGAVLCQSGTCEPFPGVEIEYESFDGSVRGSCVTQIEQTPSGEWAICDYEYVRGIPTTLTLVESTLPRFATIVSPNPQNYLVPENPDGPLYPVLFEIDLE